MMIDCHAHFVPSSLLEAVRTQAAAFPSLRLVEDGAAFGFSFGGGKPTRPVCRHEATPQASLRAAAIMSPSCAILIGRLFTAIPSGRIASLIALAIAAGAPR